MGKQKTVATGKRPGRPRNSAKGNSGRCGGRGEPKNRFSQSATPAPKTSYHEATPKLTLRVNMGLDLLDPDLQTTSLQGSGRDQDDKLSQQLAEPAPITTRTGRTIQKPQQYDTLQGSEIDFFIDQNSEDLSDGNGHFLASDPPYVSHKAQEHFQQLSKPRGRPPKNDPLFRATVGKVDEEDEESSSSQTIQVQFSLANPAHFVADTDVYAILDALRSTTRTFIDLPGLSNASDPGRAQPYSAKALTQLYILCYQEQRWDLCDMISDTWIRAFHDLRKQGQRKPKHQTWRPNPALDRRKRKSQEAWTKGQSIPSEFDPNPKDYDLVVTDPELEKDVTWINTDLLNLLYEFTSPKCGGRFLWADALALYGHKAEKVIEGVTREGFNLHPELLFNIMQTSLRMCRKNLTLKIEESTEGAWCKRYHEHGRNGQRCYRELASRNGEVEGGVDESGAKAMGGEKRGPEDDEELGPNKRTRWDWEDEDAERDSEED